MEKGRERNWPEGTVNAKILTKRVLPPNTKGGKDLRGVCAA